MNRILGIATLVLSAVMPFYLGCSDDDDDDLVTVTGMVLSIERGVCISGVKVWLIDKENEYSSAEVGEDCLFTLRVPRGSPFIFVTDDFDESVSDNVVEFINYDPLHTATIEKDISGILVHTCPSRDYWMDTVGEDRGGVRILDEYLSEGDASNGDIFDPASYAGATAGAIAFVTLFIENGQFASQSDVRATIDDPDWPVAYAIFEKIWSPELGFLDATMGPATFFPPSRDRTDESGLAYSFGSSAPIDGTVSLSITELNAGRGLVLGGPWEIPVRPNALTLVLPTCIDGECGKKPAEGFAALE